MSDGCGNVFSVIVFSSFDVPRNTPPKHVGVRSPGPVKKPSGRPNLIAARCPAKLVYFAKKIIC